jgi:carbonic anhydrase/acetyltransferase-like protein (isoleucine patch superfamily)
MPFYAINKKAPKLEGKGHFIAPNASLIGDVILKANASVWFNVVIRAENDSITIGAHSNVQDGSVLHVDPGFPLVIGDSVTIGHKVMLHGCTIGEGSLIGINAVVLNGAVIGKHCLIGANALVTEHMIIPDGAMMLGSPAKIKRMLTEEEQMSLLQGAKNYVANSVLFNAALKDVSSDYE